MIARSCVICGNPILPHRNLREAHKTCGKPECIRAWRRRYQRERKRMKRQQKIKQERDAVVCRICGEDFQVIQYTHLRKHGLTIDQYMSQYPDAPMMVKSVLHSRGVGSIIHSRYLTYNGKEPDVKLLEFLTGSLLGDGSLELRPSKTNARYAEGGKNELYLRWKLDLLSEYFPCSFDERLSSPHTKSGKRYHGWWVRTGVHPLLTQWHEQWYMERKVVPQTLVERYLTTFALAVWFCDDGHADRHGALIYTYAFSLEEVEFLSNLLKSRFDLGNEVRKNKSDQPFLWFCAKEKRHLQKLIAPISIPGMEYKYAQGVK